MLTLTSGLVVASSVGYLGYAGNQFFKFQKFKNSKRDNDLYLLSGKLNCSKNLKDIYINRGIVKNDDYIIWYKVGNVYAPFRHNYTTTDWKEIYYNRLNIENVKINNKELDLNKYKYKLCVEPKITKVKPIDAIPFFKIYPVNGHPTSSVDKYKFNEYQLKNNNKVVAVGKYISSKKFAIKYIGHRQNVLDNVREDIYNIDYGVIFIVTMVLILACIYLYNDIQREFLKFYKFYS